MKKKIIITGGLGYIGSELCKIYSGVSWKHKIVVLDNRFVSNRVNQLRNWNIEFIQGNILDKILVEKLFKDADIVHHLAGVTEVARTKEEQNAEKDKLLTEVAEVGTSIVLSETPEKCKIIFPSTHVVFEGKDTADVNIKEDYERLRLGSNFEKTVQNVDMLFNIRKKYYPESITEIRISGVDSEKKLDRDKFKNFWIKSSFIIKL